MHKMPFQINTRCINQAAIARTAGNYVEVIKQPAGNRALFIFDDTPEIRDLLDRYERKECLPLPAKAVLNARTDLYHEAAKAVRGGL